MQGYSQSTRRIWLIKKLFFSLAFTAKQAGTHARSTQSQEFGIHCAGQTARLSGLDPSSSNSWLDHGIRTPGLHVCVQHLVKSDRLKDWNMKFNGSAKSLFKLAVYSAHSELRNLKLSRPYFRQWATNSNLEAILWLHNLNFFSRSQWKKYYNNKYLLMSELII